MNLDYERNLKNLISLQNQRKNINLVIPKWLILYTHLLEGGKIFNKKELEIKLVNG